MGLLTVPLRLDPITQAAHLELVRAFLVPECGTASVVSEVLSGKRRLSLTHIKRLAVRFGLPADVFVDAAATPTARQR